MKFEEALIYLKQGRKLRRSYWPKGIYISKSLVTLENYDTYVDVAEIWIDESGNEVPVNNPWLCSSDLFEDDWELID
jgi:hypothetical protein